MTETIKSISKVFIQGSVDDVWREITKTDEAQGAFFNMQLHTEGLRPGAKIFMRSLDGKYTGVVGEVLEYDPPRRYSHTFKFTAYDDPPCKVTYVLEPKEGGVEFSLIAEDIPAGTKTADQMTKGGDFICKTLKAIVENGSVPFGTKMLYVLFKLMEPMTPKKSLTENWR